MNKSQLNVPEARSAMDKFKMEAANDLEVPAPYSILTGDYQIGEPAHSTRGVRRTPRFFFQPSTGRTPGGAVFPHPAKKDSGTPTVFRNLLSCLAEAAISSS
jgi:hypothetical protein